MVRTNILLADARRGKRTFLARQLLSWETFIQTIEPAPICKQTSRFRRDFRRGAGTVISRTDENYVGHNFITDASIAGTIGNAERLRSRDGRFADLRPRADVAADRADDLVGVSIYHHGEVAKARPALHMTGQHDVGNRF